MSKVLTIGRLAEATGTSVETIRFYEKSGILPSPARTDGNYRSYEPAHLNRLSFIRRARELGFSLDQVKELLRLSDDRSQSCAAVDDIAKLHRTEVERKISDLLSLKTELDRIIDTCRCGTVADCRIIESLSPADAARSEGDVTA
ncbi:helix-turn-helix domain-containing protein [Shinella sp. CPCC 100929]|jgi:Cu(I)-responsive transcriptional regulator|uniref:Helix-turn-helix domain-containing protein n=1 Tax=Shinella lacus TaxID=2654216 RepID=A0ABT1RE22_9HYPH|nr:helix-turn-helix domain-containing protein [Shinella lacus]MCQ4633442.1 helix-turn-helix domain-containing protein [Shinella lacus]